MRLESDFAVQFSPLVAEIIGVVSFEGTPSDFSAVYDFTQGIMYPQKASVTEIEGGKEGTD